ncbi:DNA alkylation repair protein [Micromonospora chokoriensis]|uniref:DNA alkylation repair enzyme n=1 Tax=Micromonospora chokoriensis TaxID=356851 RepID=A0A1C4XI81_9ACTN|nr:DNA alkylation repair protein [Micromonospora chokoriensis]SCF08124.1 DNA alkylation repair enzyme [Micromonospora chokoriensis]
MTTAGRSSVHVMGTSVDVRRDLASLADPRRAEASSRFLQMVPDGYGQGDRAIGVAVPDQRRVPARYWRDLSLVETTDLLHGEVHEERLRSLREVGNRDRAAAEDEFLLRRYRVMPRVMLRYATEKFAPQRRRDYLSGIL